MTPGPFASHLVDAIALNRARRADYAYRSAGRSEALSALLIAVERCCLPAAALVDWRARPFNAAAVPIVHHEFAPMSDVLPANTPPTHTRQATQAERRHIAPLPARLLGVLRAQMRTGDFEGGAQACMAALDAVQDFQDETQVHYAMTIHLVESVGLACLNAVGYASLTGGATGSVSRQLVRLQAAGLPFALHYDRLAQASHAVGVGVLVNDVPPIPFRARWQHSRAAPA
jgi:hypothetical protein